MAIDERYRFSYGAHGIDKAVPMSVIEDIKAELMSEKYAFIIPTKTVIEIINRHISGEDHRKEQMNGLHSGNNIRNCRM